LIRQALGAKQLKDFRPIAVLATLDNIYSRTLLKLCGDAKGSLDGLNFTVRAHYQAEEISFILKSLIN
jgi:hypothetical protein